MMLSGYSKEKFCYRFNKFPDVDYYLITMPNSGGQGFINSEIKTAQLSE